MDARVIDGKHMMYYQTRLNIRVHFKIVELRSNTTTSLHDYLEPAE